MQVSITNVRLKFSYSFFFNSKIITCINWAVSSLMQVLFSCSAKVSQQINRVFKKSGFPWIFKWQVVTHIKIYHSTRLSENLYIKPGKEWVKENNLHFLHLNFFSVCNHRWYSDTTMEKWRKKRIQPA